MNTNQGYAASYREQVDHVATTLMGVSYSELIEMAPSMDAGTGLLEMSERTGTSPLRFVTALAGMQKLLLLNTPGEASPALRELIAGSNRWRAAMTEFGTTDKEWQVATDGRIYTAVGNTAWRMDVISVVDKQFPRAPGQDYVPEARIQLARQEMNVAPVLAPMDGDALKRISPINGPFEPVGIAMDISDALDMVQAQRHAPAAAQAHAVKVAAPGL